jgi:ATP-dependent DNA helicase RecG
MRAFADGEIDLLLATTVIEVGVDVANATVMVIMGADRFGLSQLHQLRGRVGRGDHAGLCLLLTDLDENGPALGRLDQLAATDDGFEVAEIDLQAREEGNVLGQSQHGRSRNLKYLSVINDMDVLEATRMDAFALVEEDPLLTAHPLLAEACLLLDAESEGSFLDKA